MNRERPIVPTINKQPDTRWLLALESSTNHGGAALLDNGRLADEIPLEKGLRHGRDLMPAAKTLLDRHSLLPTDIGCVAASIGPGSYTGLRVGVMAAKAFAFASGCRLIAVSSLAALAASHALEHPVPPGTLMMTLVEARRDEVYAGLYRAEENGLPAAIAPDAAITPEEAAIRYRELRLKKQDCLALGTAFATYEKLFPNTHDFTPIAVNVRAAGVAALAWQKYRRNQFENPLALQPLYLRRDENADWRHDTLITR